MPKRDKSIMRDLIKGVKKGMDLAGYDNKLMGKKLRKKVARQLAKGYYDGISGN